MSLQQKKAFFSIYYKAKKNILIMNCTLVSLPAQNGVMKWMNEKKVCEMSRNMYETCESES